MRLDYPAKPQAQATDSALSFGRALFAYLLVGYVERREVFGLLTYDELELAQHASVDMLRDDASAHAIETVAAVRYHVAMILHRHRLESLATVPVVKPDEPTRGNALVPLIPAPKPLTPVDSIAF